MRNSLSRIARLALGSLRPVEMMPRSEKVMTAGTGESSTYASRTWMGMRASAVRALGFVVGALAFGLTNPVWGGGDAIEERQFDLGFDKADVSIITRQYPPCDDPKCKGSVTYTVVTFVPQSIPCVLRMYYVEGQYDDGVLTCKTLNPAVLYVVGPGAPRQVKKAEFGPSGVPLVKLQAIAEVLVDHYVLSGLIQQANASEASKSIVDLRPLQGPSME